MTYIPTAFIDGITNTVSLTFEQGRQLMGRLEATEPFAPHYRTRVRTGLYRVAYLIPLGRGRNCLAEMHPIGGNQRNFLRLELNPGRTTDAVRALVEIMNSFLADFDMELLLSGNTTSLHIALDIPGLEIEDADAHGLLRRRWSERYQVFEEAHPHGWLNAIRVGRRGSESCLLLYDKTEEIRQRKEREAEVPRAAAPQQLDTRLGAPSRAGPRLAPHNLPPSTARRIPRQLARLELQLRPGRATQDILPWGNQFERYVIVTHETVVAPPDDLELFLFKHAVKGSGSARILSSITNQRKRDYLRRHLVQTPPPPWWNPERMWDDFRRQWAALYRVH